MSENVFFQFPPNVGQIEIPHRFPSKDSDYFLKQYKGLSIKYEEETAHQIFLDLAAIIDTDNDGLITEKDLRATNGGMP